MQKSRLAAPLAGRCLACQRRPAADNARKRGAKSILMSEILNVFQDFQQEELPQKNTKDTKEDSERNCIQSFLCFLRFFAAIAFEFGQRSPRGPGDGPRRHVL